MNIKEIIDQIKGCDAEDLAALLVRIAKDYAEKTREEMAEIEGGSQTLELEANGVSVVNVEIRYNYEWEKQLKEILQIKEVSSKCESESTNGLIGKY